MKHQQVVVAYDFSPMGAAVLARAVALVTRAPSHILQFVTVVDKSVDYERADEIRDDLAAKVREAFGSAQIPDEVHFYVHARIGKPVKEILDLAEEVGADLILVGTHGRTGLARAMMGSTAEHVMRDAGCPVLVVRPKRYADIELPVVTEVDSSHPSSKVLHGSIGGRPFEWLTP